uniref:Beta-defensin n=1 Tax=Anolis carolinensis TaxID=28377 RepID=A0A803SUF9_ANOCA
MYIGSVQMIIFLLISIVAIQPRNTIFCNAAGARCRRHCLSREWMIGRCNAKKRCCHGWSKCLLLSPIAFRKKQASV